MIDRYVNYRYLWIDEEQSITILIKEPNVEQLEVGKDLYIRISDTKIEWYDTLLKAWEELPVWVL